MLLDMSRSHVGVDEALLRKARALTGIKSTQEIVQRALELLIRVEARKGILAYYGSGIWEGDTKVSRRSRAKK
jgi:hypothetical protein